MKNSLLLLIAAAMLSASCGAKQPAAETEKKALTGVVTETLRLSPIDDIYEVSGTVRSKVSTAVAARTTGQISRVLVTEGDRVRAGQLLVEIDSRDAAIQVLRAQAAEAESLEGLEEVNAAIRAAEFARTSANANRDLAGATLERYRGLRDRRSISLQEFEEVQARNTAAAAEASRASETLDSLKAKRGQMLARIEQAKAGRGAADLYLGYAQVLAPIDGIVTARHVEPGMLATPGVPLITVEDDGRYQLELAVDESRIAAIARGARTRVRIESLGEDNIDAVVSEILPASDSLTRTLTVRLDLPRTPNVRSGLFGRAYFPAGRREGITIPQAAVVRRGQLTGTWVVEGGAVRYRLLRTGKAAADRVEVLSGLNEGDLLILEPREGLADGLEVRP